MPVRFLSDAELARLSSWPDEIADDDLVTYFTLTSDDLGWLGANVQVENHARGDGVRAGPLARLPRPDTRAGPRSRLPALLGTERAVRRCSATLQTTGACRLELPPDARG